MQLAFSTLTQKTLGIKGHMCTVSLFLCIVELFEKITYWTYYQIYRKIIMSVISM